MTLDCLEPSAAPVKPLPREMRPFRASLGAAAEAVDRDSEHVSQFVSLLRRMHYDDALVCGVWRLELLYLERGKPHYRLYWHDFMFGVADIYTEYGDLTDSCHMPLVRARMAAYLVACGCQASEATFERYASITPLDANTSRQHRLFKVKAPQTRPTEWQIIEENWLGPEVKGIHTARQAYS
jgi:hypothetical protein